MSSQPKTAPKPSEPEAPAGNLRGYVRDRAIDTTIGGQLAWRNKRSHQLEWLLEHKKIESDEFAAGECYRKFYDNMMPQSVDSTQRLVVARSGEPEGFTPLMLECRDIVKNMERNLSEGSEHGPRYVVLIRKLCGEGYKASEACRIAGFSDAREVIKVTKLALSKLSVAITKTSFVIRTSLAS